MDQEHAQGTGTHHHHDSAGSGARPVGHFREVISRAFREPGNRSLLVGLASLLWLLLRTGMKPSRAAYPCQRAAMANASAWIGTLALPAFWRGSAKLRGPGVKPIGAVRQRFPVLLAAAIIIAGMTPLAVDLFSKATPAGKEQILWMTLAGWQHLPSGYSDIYAVQGTTGADGGFQSLVDIMGQNGLSFYSLIGPKDVVIIKVNSQWDERGGTNTDLVKAIIESILKHPAGFTGEIVIADNGQAQYGAAGSGGSLDWKSNNAEDRTQSMQNVADSFSDRYKVSTALWDRITTTRVAEYAEGDERSGYVLDSSPSPRTGIVVSYPKFKTPYSTLISFKKGIWNPASRSYDSDGLKVINVPVLKSHSIYGVTASVKHYMGVGSEKLTRSAHRSVGAGGMGTEMAETRVPVLNVIDAVWVNANPGRGPWTSYSDASRVGVIAAGRDPVSLDYWAAKSILLPAAQELGYRNTDSLNPDITRNGSFGSWLRLSMKELQRAGHPSTLDMEGINVIVRPLE
jgi:uncharacterized protein (DUF362 family)